MDAVKAEVVRTEYCFDQIYDQHCHANYELLFVLKGSIKLNLEGEHILLNEDDGIIITPLKYHIVTGSNGTYHRLIVTFDKDAVPSELYPQFLQSLKRNYRFSSKPLSSLFRRYASMLEKNDAVYDRLLHAIFTEAVYELTFGDPVPSEIPDGKPRDKIRQIVSYINRNLDREISLGEIAEELYMSESSLCHIFKAEMNISLKQYILQKKMMYAEYLLRNGTSPAAAASACGYKNYASFYKMFLKNTGIKPSQVLP